jgi:hypothetical protein
MYIKPSKELCTFSFQAYSMFFLNTSKKLKMQIVRGALLDWKNKNFPKSIP